MDVLIKEQNGKEEIWYSKSYLKQQMELAYQAGMHRGIKIQFHAVQPMDGKGVENLVNEFKKRLDDEYQKAYVDCEIWKIDIAL